MLDISFKERENFLEEIRLTLYVNKEFPEKYIKPIVESMNHCAVKDQLHPYIKIIKEIADETKEAESTCTRVIRNRSPKYNILFNFKSKAVIQHIVSSNW